MEELVQNQLVQAAKVIEEQVDAEIERLERLDEDELEKLRENRLKAMKQAANLQQENISKGHGEYSEISEEKELFDACKKSERLVCHFYRDSTFRCSIVDKHLQILAKSHVETRFVKLNVERAPFLVKRLNIRILPTIALMNKGKTGDFIVGFDDMGGIDDFATEMLEWRLGCSKIIDYSGDLLHPPDVSEKRKPSFLNRSKKTIRDKDDDSSDSDED